VSDRAMRVPQHYDIAIDRAGLALGVGSALAGCIVLALLLLGGGRDPIALVVGWLIGGVFSGIAMTAVGGPLWLVMHVAGLRRARHAALVGALTAMAIFVGAQTYGFGLFEMPPMDNRALLFRWVSAIASSAVLAGFAAAIGAVMWRIAYRRER
jgi:MFS family permease